MKILLKVAVALVAVGVLAVLFLRSVESTRAEPFRIAQQDLTGWTLTLAPAGDQLGSLLSITPTRWCSIAKPSRRRLESPSRA